MILRMIFMVFSSYNSDTYRHTGMFSLINKEKHYVDQTISY
jgi:hypothetical protein